jgi:hypothetical protein
MLFIVLKNETFVTGSVFCRDRKLMLDFIEKGGDLRRLPHLNPSADKLFKPTPTGPAPGQPLDSSNISGFLQAQLEEVHYNLVCGNYLEVL